MPNKTVASPKKRERRDRKEEILLAATRLFSEKGYSGTSLASIAKEIELTEPGLLHYFPSKVKLLQGVLEYRDKEDEQKYLPIVNPENPEFTKMMKVLQHLVADNQQKPALIRLFTILVAESIRTDHPSHDHFVERYNLARQAYGNIFRDLQNEGQINANVDPNLIGILVISIMDGLQIQWLLDPEHVDMTESFALFIKMIGKYLYDEID